MDNINIDKIIKTEEIDQSLILDVPEEAGNRILEVIQSEDGLQTISLELLQSLNDNMQIEESRKLIFKENNNLFPATILDFPCIIEAMKTMDYKTFYKASDISQMIYVHDTQLQTPKEINAFNPFNCNDDVFNRIIWLNDLDHKYKLKHGLTRACKNIRAKRFKVQQRYDKTELGIVCKKLKDIIDNGAAKFEKNLLVKTENETKTDNEYKVEEISYVSSNKYEKYNNSINKNNINKDSMKNKENSNNPISNPSKAKIEIKNHIKTEQNEPSSDNLDILNLENEYIELRRLYDNLKVEIEANPNEIEKVKLKKKIKKRLKVIKQIILGKGDEEASSQH